MRTIAIINQKGGCGKTTTSINLAACLARLGQKTLLVDMDPQGHCAVGLAVPEEQIERTIFDALIEDRDGKPVRLADTVWQIATDFDLSPSNIRLAAFEQTFAGRMGREDRLKKALEPVQTAYRWCIVDCPPSVGLITFNALRACDEVIVPVETGYFSLHGLAKMMETLEVLREKCGKEILIRVLPTLYDTRTKLAREVLSELRNRFKEYLMESAVNFNTKLKEAASFGQPITEYDPGSRGYKDFVNLARELMGHHPAESEPTPMEKLSRPAELVQRAKQLAQLTNLQFGRNSVTTPTPAAEPRGQSPAQVSDSPIRIPNEPVVPVSAMSSPAPVSTLMPIKSYTPPSTLALLPAGGAAFNGPFSSGTLAGQTLSSSITAGGSSGTVVGGNLSGAAASSAPIMPSGMIVSGSQAEEAALDHYRGESIFGGRFGSSGSFSLGSPASALSSAEEDLADNSTAKPSGKNGDHGALTLTAPTKTTAQKIQEFYGVKQVGDEVMFAAKFSEAKKVLIAGDFNNWSPMSTPMMKRSRPGDFYVSLPLRPGRYRYRFVVDGRWMTDPNNNYVEANQFGELNNVIEVD
ncbi:MAG: AAA family ATPase [Planctomycetota bacterium]|nr:AAA family ATPase [Planctomycetota bacterium]